MKRNQLNDLKKSETKELAQKAQEIKKELQTLVLSKTTGKLTDLKQIMKKRRDLAQILTILNQKQLINAMKGDK